jgi:hypothetical protein
MAKEYIQFGLEWRKTLSRQSKESLEKLFKVDAGLHPTKEKLIDAIRTDLIVTEFNKKHPVGSTVYWRASSHPGTSYLKLTVKSPAFNSHGTPVVFFAEKSGFCSIEPHFLES